MNDWATSPWATNNATPSLSPAPPAFAKTSPAQAALGSGYFDGFSNEAGWADTVTSGAGAIGGAENTVGLQSPRPIASPGRVANGKGNRYIRPILSIWDTQEVEESDSEAVGGAIGQLDEVPGLERKEDTDQVVVANGIPGALEDHWNTAGVENGLRIDMEDSSRGDPSKTGTLHTPRIEALQAEDVDIVSHTEQDQSGLSSAADLPTHDGITPKSATDGGHATDSVLLPSRFPHSKVVFPIDPDLLAKFIERNTDAADLELPMLDSIITTSSQRKAQHRLTRPYTLRQYSLGEFENYRRVTWGSSIIHDEVINIVGKWIAKDRASGGGMFDATLANRSGNFGWGSEGKRDMQNPEVSASSILLPKIAAPSGFNWSSSSMVPLSPRKLGEIDDESPRASEDIKQMQPRQRRTPIRRKPRAVSGKSMASPKSPSITNGARTDSLDDLIFPPIGATSPLAQASNEETSMNHSLAAAEDDFGIFEQKPELDSAFEDFVIAPPPAISSPVPKGNVSQDSLQVDNVPSSDDGQVDVQHPRSISETTATATEVTSPSVQRTLPSLYNDELGSPSMLHTERASPIKETLEDQSLVLEPNEDFVDFDDFDAFESAPPLEYTDTPDELQPTHDDKPRLGQQAPTPETEGSLQQGFRDDIDMDSISARSLDHEGVVETALDDFSTFESSLPPSVLSVDSQAGVKSTSAASKYDTVLDEAIHSETIIDSTEHPNEVEEHNGKANDAIMAANKALVKEGEPSVETLQSSSPVLASFEHSVATQESLHPSLSLNDEPAKSSEIFPAFDDFSIFETSTNKPTSNNFAASQAASMNLDTHDLTPTPTSLDHSEHLESKDVDDDFGAFEDAVSPVASATDMAWPVLAPPTIPTSSSSWNMQNRFSVPLTAQTMSFTPLMPDLAPPRANTAPPLDLFPAPSTQPLKSAVASLLSTTAAPARPSSALALSSLSSETEALPKPQPPRNAQMMPSRHPTSFPVPLSTQSRSTTTTTSPSSLKTKAKSTGTKANPRHDAGDAILGVLAFLDAEDEAADDADTAEDAFSAWSNEAGMDGASEALASQKEVRRLRREEWVGERPGEKKVKSGEGEHEVDQEAVQRVVDGLPDWRYLL